MRILFCGDRNWSDYDSVLETMRSYKNNSGLVTVIEGEARGADTLARIAGEELGLTVVKYPADWDRHGKAAGPIRNQQMLDEGQPDMVVAFHNNINNSKGTRDMITRAKKAGINCVLFRMKLECIPQ